MHYLGNSIDVQGGGSDLIFPHHEMSASEAQVATGERFAKAYVHAGMVGFEGEKMSKSKGNLVLFSKLRAAGRDPMAIRLSLLAHHYRSDWEWFDTDISGGEKRLAAWREAVGRTAGPSGEKLVNDLREALADDLDAPRALEVMDNWATDDSTEDESAPETAAIAVNALLGVKL
ncbi:MAG: cysteine--1-D-myo-inosityl 2-amino-2-deoxy-alpha-D-glucopyranoside ligase, partial [Aeromicrobium sp.]